MTESANYGYRLRLTEKQNISQPTGGLASSSNTNQELDITMNITIQDLESHLGTVTSLPMSDSDLNPQVFETLNLIPRSRRVSATRWPGSVGQVPGTHKSYTHGTSTQYLWVILFTLHYSMISTSALDHARVSPSFGLLFLFCNTSTISSFGIKPAIRDHKWRTVAARVDLSERLWRSFVTVSPSRENPHSTSHKDAKGKYQLSSLKPERNNTPGADRKSNAMFSSGISPSRYHHCIGSKFAGLEMGGVRRKSSSSSLSSSLPKLSISEKSRLGSA